jgi:hypothetical protein
VGGHAGAFQSGKYITIPEAKFSTAGTLQPHHAPAEAGKYFGVGGHAGAFQSGKYITIPEAKFSTAGTLQPHHAPAEAGKFFGVGGHAGDFHSPQYVTIPEAHLATAPAHGVFVTNGAAPGSVKAAAALTKKALASSHTGGKFFGAGGHAGDFHSPQYVTIPEADVAIAHASAPNAAVAAAVKMANLLTPHAHPSLGHGSSLGSVKHAASLVSPPPPGHIHPHPHARAHAPSAVF